jgi:hypothetical protein
MTGWRCEGSRLDVGRGFMAAFTLNEPSFLLWTSLHTPDQRGSAKMKIVSGEGGSPHVTRIVRSSIMLPRMLPRIEPPPFLYVRPAWWHNDSFYARQPISALARARATCDGVQPRPQRPLH